jgi:hypothetical protein
MDANGECPKIEFLERYAAGRLPDLDAEELEAHLEVCGICSLIVERMGDFDHAAAVEREPTPGWQAMEARMGFRGEAHQRGWRNWFLFRYPALGYVLALALAYPSWLGVTRKAGAPTAQGEWAGSWARSVDLNAVRGQSTAAVISPATGERALVLEFFVPAGEGVRQRAELRDNTGKTMEDLGEVKSYDGRGNFAVVLDPRKLPVGRYRLVVLGGANGERQETGFDFERR